MDYGVTFTGVGPMADPENLRRLTRKAEHLGFKSVWLYDHVTFPGKAPEKSPFTPETPFLSPVTTLAFLAAETKQIRLGTGVLLVALRHPLLIAKDVATLDVISGGRAILGLGLGWLEPEFQWSERNSSREGEPGSKSRKRPVGGWRGDGSTLRFLCAKRLLVRST